MFHVKHKAMKTINKISAQIAVNALTAYVVNVLDKIHVSADNLDKHVRFRNMCVYIINELTTIYELEKTI